MRTILEPFIYYLIPGKIENLLERANGDGNFGLYGLYLGVRNRRNMIYLSTYFTVGSYFFKYKNVTFILGGLLSIQLYSYCKYILRYKYNF
jgi:hypothetical protein